MKTVKRIMLMLSITALLCCLLSVAAFAAGLSLIHISWRTPMRR